MQEALLIVSHLNTEFYEKTGNEEWTPFGFDTDGTEYRITFLGFPVFSSAADYVDTRAGKTLRDVILSEIDKMMKDIDTFNRNRDRS